MALRTNEQDTKFGDVVDQILRRDGIDTSQVGLATDLVAYVNDRLQKAWSHEFWPQTMLVEKKHYHQVYCVGQQYEVGDVLWDVDLEKYFYCIEPTTDFLTEGDDASWKEVDETTDWLKIIPFWQNGSLPTSNGSEVVHRVQSVSMRSPHRSYSPGILSYEILGNGILVSKLAANEVYLKYQKEPPLFTLYQTQSGQTYSPRLAFGGNSKEADVVYDPSTKNCYKAINNTTADDAFTDNTKWEIVPFPKFLQRYVIHGAFADWLASEGQQAKSQVEDEFAEKILYDLMDIHAPSSMVQDTATYSRV